MTTQLYGVIESMTKKEMGYTCLVILSDIPYDRIYKKFNVWRNKTIDLSKFSEEDQVEITFEDRPLGELVTISKCSFDSCVICRSFFVPSDGSVECTKCQDPELVKHEFIGGTYELIGKVTKQERYNKSLTVTFYDPDEGCHYMTRIYETHTLYKSLLALNIGSFYQWCGWLKTETRDAAKTLKFFDMLYAPILRSVDNDSGYDDTETVGCAAEKKKDKRKAKK